MLIGVVEASEDGMEFNRSAIAYAGPQIVTSTALLDNHCLVVRGERIADVMPISALPASTPIKHIAGAYLTPGFIDLHVHGAMGRAYNEGSVEAIEHIGNALLSAGVTTALPTLASASIDELVQALDALSASVDISLSVEGTGAPTDAVSSAGDRDFADTENPTSSPRASPPATLRIPGANLEGPYFSHVQAGAQDPHALRTPSDGSVEDLLAYTDAISMMSFAPELDGAIPLTERLVEAGIVAAAGHSDGTAEDLQACQVAGLSHIIHVFSGQSTTRRVGPWRVPGVLEATLASEDLTVEMISDGKHLPPLLMRLAHRSLGDRLCLVSDATPGAGNPEGSSYRMGAVTYRVGDGVGLTEDGTAFGGSTTLLPQMVPIAVRALGLSIPQAVAMVTSIPAGAARLSGVGRLAPGYWADLAVLDQDLIPCAVAVRGHWHTSPTGKERP
ncbi:N-acetylglucosamine-6-phosphate deacetylase [Pseudactinotalea sp. Z1732]|uniref:N-acetylglucosamine-6-phosphate deacetylase n=1 Tax=Pseudactinotalea sp. Z1732 TaxID=3413026 RepID=UPI003C7B5CBF